MENFFILTEIICEIPHLKFLMLQVQWQAQKIFKFGGSERYFQHFSRNMYPKNRPRISVKRQVFSVLTSAYFRGPDNLYIFKY